MIINPIYDTSDQSFKNDIQAAINIYESLFPVNITVNIRVGDGDYNGTPLQNQNISEGNIATFNSYSYTTLRADLLAAVPGFFNNNNLPNTSSINGQSSFIIGSAQERIFGIRQAQANPGDIDGIVGIGTGFSAGAVRISGALHEIGHALGRIPGSELDLFRFFSPGVHNFTNGVPEAASYFSIDGGNTKIADWGQNSDPSDFLGPTSNPSSNLTPNDPYDESVGNLANLTAIDIQVMEALGFSNFQDVIGAPGNDIFVAFAGSHRYVGQGTSNTITYANAPTAVNLSLDSGAAQPNGFGGTDLLVNIQNVVGSAFNDIIIGSSSSNNVLAGGPDIITPVLGSLPAQTGQIGSEWHVVSAQDFTGDGKGDIMWVRNNSGDAVLWTMNNGTLASAGATQGHMGAEWTAIGSGDFNHDGIGDLVWVSNGNVAIWEMNGTTLTNFTAVSGHMGAEWSEVGIGDFNGDGVSDLLWHSNTGNSVVVWSMNGTAIGGVGVSNGHIGTEWSVAAIGDFHGIGRDDILWMSNTGDLQTWTMNGSNVTAVTSAGHIGTNWHVAGTGDFNMDGTTDVVWVDNNNNVQIWEMKNGAPTQFIVPAGHQGPEWSLKNVGDFTGDGRPDLLWVNGNTGQTAVWNMTGNGDILTGNGGPGDIYPINGLNELGKVITDFAAGSPGDVLDLPGVEAAAGYNGGNGLRDGEIRAIQNGANTEVQIDAHFGEHHWLTAATLLNVNATSLVQSNFIG